MPRVAARQIPLYFKPPHVATTEIDKIILFYNNGLALSDMIRRIQYAKSERDGKCLSYPDLYTILFHAKKDGRVKQREFPLGELPISDFQFYFQAFRDGCTFDECWAAITEAGRKVTTKSFHTKLFRAMGDRFRDHSRRFMDQLDKAHTEKKERRFSTDLFKYFKRTQIGPAGKGRPAIILYLDDLPRDFLADLKALDTDFCKEMLLVLNPGMLSETEQQTVRKQRLEAASQDTAAIFTPVVAPASQEQLINDAVELLNTGIKRETKAKQPKPPPAALPPSEEEILDEQELGILTPEQLIEQEAEVAKRVALPSAHQEGSESPTDSYDLGNLSDDDSLDPEEVGPDESPNRPN